ncbi:hypothetical protein CR513_33198, partial [Mucuna pruriens]
MANSSFNIEDLSPKSRLMMKYMKKLEAKMEKLEGGLEFMKLDSHNNISQKRKTYENTEWILNEPKKNPWVSLRIKFLFFSSSGSACDYYDWELKVAQNFDYINYEDLIKVKLIALSFEGYVLIWWNEIA